LAATLGAELDGAGRVIVGPDLSIAGHPNVFVVGDLAKVVNEDGSVVPGVCPAAVQMGKFVAGVIEKECRGGVAGARPKFAYFDKGSLATIGRSRAVAWLPCVGGKRLPFTGFIAWALWAGVHVFFLIGFRSRVMVMLEWMWAYVTFSRGARLITSGVETKRAE
jgi:NADH dehydrogenase